MIRHYNIVSISICIDRLDAYSTVCAYLLLYFNCNLFTVVFVVMVINLSCPYQLTVTSKKISWVVTWSIGVVNTMNMTQTDMMHIVHKISHDTLRSYLWLTTECLCVKVCLGMFVIVCFLSAVGLNHKQSSLGSKKVS